MGTSSDVLVDSFWSHVRLGQWQLARGTIKLIKNSSKDQCKDLLTALVLQPKNHSSGSLSVPTPFHLSWLALQELKESDCLEENALSSLPIAELEFNFLLHFLKSKLSPSIFRELNQYHSYVTKSGDSDLIPPKHLSAGACDLIGASINNEPLLSLSLIESMLGKIEKFSLNDFSLLQILTNKASFLISELVNDDENTFIKNFTPTINALSFIKTHLEWADPILFQQYNNFILKTLEIKPNLTKEICSAFLDEKNVCLMKAMEDTEKQHHLSKIQLGSESDSLDITLIVDILESGKESDWKNLFLFFYEKKVHILQYVVDGCVDLILKDNFEKVKRVLKFPLFQSLKSLVLLLSWTNCASFNQAETLLRHLLPSEDEVSGLLSPACKKLIYQTKLIKWCMIKAREILGDKLDKDGLLNVLFKQLDHSSVLFVLNETKLLKTLQYKEVIDLLQQQTEIHESYKNTSEEHKTTYLCYTTIKNFSNLLIASKTKKFINDSNIEVGFTNDVLKERIESLKTDIEKILNLESRIEVLENIFSMLFIRNSDFKGFGREDIDFDNRDDSSHESSMSQSIDSNFDDESFNFIQQNVKKTQRSLIFEYGDYAEERKLISRDDINQALLQEIQDGSSSDTIKARERQDSLEKIHDMPPSFLASVDLIKEVLILISDCLVSLSVGRFSAVKEQNVDASLDYRISSLQAYTREGQWRLQLISGMNPSAFEFQKSKIIGISRNHVISKMLGSSQSLVFLTLKKGDLVQTKQVIKMFDLKDQFCSMEMDFIEQIDEACLKLKKILKIKQKKEEQSFLSMDFVKEAASAGKMSTEVKQVLDVLLQHRFLSEHAEIDTPCLALATCIDLMHKEGISLDVAKRLADLACYKLDGFNLEIKLKAVILEKAKQLKSLLNLSLNREFEMFKLCGETTPEDYLELSLSSPLANTSESLEFEEHIFVQGKNNFKILVGTIGVLQSTIQELRELDPSDNPDMSLKENENNLLKIFSSEAVSQFNQIETPLDYLKSLFRYTKNLAGLQLYFETKPDKETVTSESVRPLKVANPYLIFNEKISTIFGRLLFDWDVSPRKLEMFAKQSGVNLIRVITENCGVFEPITHSQPAQLLYQISLMDCFILNEHSDDSFTDLTLEEKSPNETLEDILTNILDMVAETSNDTPLSAPEVCQVLSISTKQLQHIDVSLLESKEDQLSFFINLFNLMFLHSIMLIASNRFTILPDLNIPKLYGVLESTLGRSAFFHLIGYKVGQMGQVTPFDVYNLVLMKNNPNDFFGMWRKRKSFAPLKLSVERDVRALFLFSFGSTDCPSIQVASPESIEVLLKSSAMEYLDRHVKIDEANSKVQLPELLILHKDLFFDSPLNNSHQELMKNLSNIVGPSLKTKLQVAVTETYEVIINKQNWTTRYPLCRKNSFTMNKTEKEKRPLPKFSSLPPRIKDYMTGTYPLAGKLIEVYVTKNNIIKETITIFNNNLLCSRSNKKDTPLSIVSPMKNGLSILTKICSDSVVLRNFVVECCSYIISTLEFVASFEQDLTVEVRGDLLKALELTLINDFLTTLSPDPLSHLLPSLLVACLQTGNCHKINLEFLVLLNKELFDLALVASSHEVKSLLVEKYKLYVDPTEPLLKELKRFLLLIKDNVLRSELILEVVALLPAEDIFDLLRVCLEANEKHPVADVRERLEKQMKETKWCHQVYSKCMLSTMSDAFTCWQDVQGYVIDDPDYVTWFLNDTNAYELMDVWFDLYNLPDSNQQRCIQAKVLYVLNDPSVTDLKVQNAFLRSKSEEMSLKVCRNIISMESKYDPNRQLIINFMLNHLASKLLESEKRNCLLNRLGICCIEAIPENLRSSYHQLQYKPIVVVEQLLMNLKVKIAGQLIHIIHNEVGKEHSELISGLSGQCDDLLGRYALLAIKMETIPSDIPVKDDSAPASPLSSRTESDTLERKNSISSHTATEKSMEFMPPTSTVKKSDWVKDEKVSSCMQCHEAFSMFNRRHHCRHCGRVVCASCSNYFCMMAGFERKERACRPCYYYLENIPLPSETSNKIVRTQTLDRTFEAPSPPPLSSAVELDWVLSPEEQLNTNTREEFRFEQAPNASLCLAIVDLYINSKAACGLLLKFCNDLSQFLQGPNPEVDVSIVSGMIEFILNQAKLKFMKNGDFGGVELCDTHLSRVEILKLLLESNWNHIPTMQEFAQPETLRKLRDKLMENERFTLALEITSKCGLDATPVHFLLGVSRLRCGHLEKAREHLSRCLTRTSGEASTSFGPNHHYLQRIIDVIENTPLIALYQSDENASISLILQDQIKNGHTKGSLDNRRYNEIVYYLKEYGSYGHMIKFFVRNHLIPQAVAYIREKRCSHELFTIHLLQSSFKDGTFEELCEKMRINDPSLKFWHVYFTFACKYLEKHGHFHSLYEVQLFIRDYFRAALTCVRFYLGTTGKQPTSYSDLFRRLMYLQKAAKHLENLVKERSSKSSFVSHVGSSFLGDDKNISNQDIPTSKLKQHLNTVNLQNDVTIFLNNTKATDSNLSGFSTSKLPTLFGNGKERTELIVSLLIHSIDESLPLASRIIQEFKLPSSPIFGRAVVRLAHEQKHSHVTNLLQNIEKNGMLNTVEKDEILLKVIKVVVQKSAVKEATQFIKQIRGEPAKINAFIICGRLRDAYLEAVKKERVTEIQRILDAARQAPNQKSMVDICEKWLKTYQENQARKERALNLH